MAFLPVKSDHGAVLPFEYLPAAAGEYKAGQLVGVKGGKAAALEGTSTATPPYVCVFEGRKEEGEPLPVTRVSRDYIYETTLKTDMAVVIGVKLSVAEDGLHPAAAAGTFEVTAAEGTAAGDTVRGRFL